MLKQILNILSGIISGYFVVLSVYTGVMCILSVAPYIKRGGYEKEGVLAVYGGYICIIGSICLYFILKIFT